MAATAKTIKQAASSGDRDGNLGSKAAAVGGALSSRATSALKDRPVVERLAALLTTRFLGVNLVDLLKEIDRSGVDLGQLGEPEQLERLAGAITGSSSRADGGDKGASKREEGNGKGSQVVKKGAKTVAGLSLVRRFAVPLGLTGAGLLVTVLVVRVAKSRKKEPAGPDPETATETASRTQTGPS